MNPGIGARLAAAIGLVLIAAGLLLFLSGFSDFVVLMGHQIPQTDLATDYAIGVAWAMFLGLTILTWPVPTRHKPMLLWAWLAKSLVTLGIMLLYENHYGLDAYYYFEASRRGPPSLPMIGDGTATIISLTRLHRLLLPDSYHMMKVTFSMLGLISVYIVFRAALRYLDTERSALFYALALFPSVLFWSSILGKDPLALLGMAVYIYGVVGWHKTNSFAYVLMIAASLVWSMFIRLWLGPIMLAPLAVFALNRMKGFLTRLFFLTFVFAGFFYSLGFLREVFRLESRQDLIERSQSVSRAWAIGGSGRQLDSEMDSVGQIVAFLPLGMFTALFRPLPGEVLNPFGMLSGLENLGVLLILARAFMRTRWVELRDPVLLWAVTLLATWSSFYGLISSQNLGTAVRFRLQVMPLLLCVLFHFGRSRLKEALARQAQS